MKISSEKKLMSALKSFFTVHNASVQMQSYDLSIMGDWHIQYNELKQAYLDHLNTMEKRNHKKRISDLRYKAKKRFKLASIESDNAETREE